jgi:hypothetical protein
MLSAFPLTLYLLLPYAFNGRQPGSSEGGTSGTDVAENWRAGRQEAQAACQTSDRGSLRHAANVCQQFYIGGAIGL